MLNSLYLTYNQLVKINHNYYDLYFNASFIFHVLFNLQHYIGRLNVASKNMSTEKVSFFFLYIITMY